MVVKAYCGYIGLDYQPSMLQWDSKEDDDHAAQVFATWTAFHRDAIESRGLMAKKKKVSAELQRHLRLRSSLLSLDVVSAIQRGRLPGLGE
jgi:hypothetical protein